MNSNHEVQRTAPKLTVVHSVIVAFAEAPEYKTYWLHNRFLNYKGKTEARTAKLAKHMETIMKPYRFENGNPVTVLLFLRQFKRACDSNGVSESATM